MEDTKDSNDWGGESEREGEFSVDMDVWQLQTVPISCILNTANQRASGGVRTVVVMVREEAGLVRACEEEYTGAGWKEGYGGWGFD